MKNKEFDFIQLYKNIIKPFVKFISKLTLMYEHEELKLYHLILSPSIETSILYFIFLPTRFMWKLRIPPPIVSIKNRHDINKYKHIEMKTL